MIDVALRVARGGVMERERRRRRKPRRGCPPGEHRRGRRDWAAILAAQAKSGQTAGIYCRGHGIPYKSFLYHRRKAEAGASRGDSQRSAPMSGFVPVRVSGAPRVVLRLPAGIVLECERLPEAWWLVDLARRWGTGVASC